MKIAPEKIGFDFDGVIADTGEAFIRLACQKFGYCSFTINDITAFELEGCIDMPREMVHEIFNDLLDDSLSHGLKPITGASQTLTMLAEVSRVKVVTARSKLQPVQDWFAAILPEDTVEKIDVVITGDHNNKEQYLRQLGLKYFVDDRAATCEQLAAGGNIIPLVFEQPWNRGHHSQRSVAHWGELKNLIDFSR